jgi:hypothetical protein
MPPAGQSLALTWRRRITRVHGLHTDYGGARARVGHLRVGNVFDTVRACVV